MNSRFIIATEDRSSYPSVVKRFRGKKAKEAYRYVK